MKNRTIVGLLLVWCAWSAAANAAQPAAITCDRECLRGKVTQLLYALLKHDVSGLPVAGSVYACGWRIPTRRANTPGDHILRYGDLAER